MKNPDAKNKQIPMQNSPKGRSGANTPEKIRKGYRRAGSQEYNYKYFLQRYTVEKFLLEMRQALIWLPKSKYKEISVSKEWSLLIGQL